MVRRILILLNACEHTSVGLGSWSWLLRGRKTKPKRKCLVIIGTVVHAELQLLTEGKVRPKELVGSGHTQHGSLQSIATCWGYQSRDMAERLQLAIFPNRLPPLDEALDSLDHVVALLDAFIPASYQQSCANLWSNSLPSQL